MMDHLSDAKIFTVRAFEDFAWGDIKLVIGRETNIHPKHVEYFDGESWCKHEIGINPHSQLIFEKSVAQQLVDDLWNCGVRPNEAKGSAGQLSAVEKHLEDMRTIAFSKLELKRINDEVI